MYRALDLELNRTVAVKVIRPEFASNLSSLLRLKREVVLASRVSGSHVVRVHDFGEVDGQALIAMDWVDGENLAALLARVHTLPPSQVCDLAAQICAALRDIHGVNMSIGTSSPVTCWSAEAVRFWWPISAWRARSCRKMPS